MAQAHLVDPARSVNLVQLEQLALLEKKDLLAALVLKEVLATKVQKDLLVQLAH